jgi:hypothetical protein
VVGERRLGFFSGLKKIKRGEKDAYKAVAHIAMARGLPLCREVGTKKSFFQI